MTPVTPITAVNRALRGRTPPGSFEPQAKEIFALREVASPMVSGRLGSVVSTMMSPEEGTLSKEDIKLEIKAILGELKRRAALRDELQQIADEKMAMEKAEKEAEAYRRKQEAAVPWMARKEALEEACEKRLVARVKCLERQLRGKRKSPRFTASE